MDNQIQDEGLGNDESQSSGVNSEALMKRIEELESSNKRLLSESKDWKNKYKEVSGERENIESKIAADTNDYKKIVELERRKASELSDKLKEREQKLLKTQLNSLVQKHAPDAVDIEDLLNQPSFSHILKEGIDTETLSIDETKVKEYVLEVFKAKPHLRKNNSQPGAFIARPKSDLPKAKSLNEMSIEEIKKSLLELKF